MNGEQSRPVRGLVLGIELGHILIFVKWGLG